MAATEHDDKGDDDHDDDDHDDDGLVQWGKEAYWECFFHVTLLFISPKYIFPG